MSTSLPAIRTVQEQVVENLRQLILEGEFAPGDKLQQEDLAETLGVSAMPIREGLRQLEAEGLVEFVPRRGAFVATLSADELDEIYRMRCELEALAFRWAIPHIGPEKVRRLRALLQRIDESETLQDVHRRAKLIRTFLWEIYEAADRSHLFQAIRRYYNMTYLYQRQYSAAFELSSRRMEIYHRMLAAIERGDTDAAIAAHRDNYQLVRDKMLRLAGHEDRGHNQETRKNHGWDTMASDPHG